GFFPLNAPSLTQRAQSILRFVNAAGNSLGIEFPCLRDTAAPAEDPPCRQGRPVVRLRQQEQRERVTALGGDALEHATRRDDLARGEQQAGLCNKARRFEIARRVRWRSHRGRPIRRARRGAAAAVQSGVHAHCQRLLELRAAGTSLRQQFPLFPAGRQQLLELLAAGAFLRQLVHAGRELPLERLAVGTFLRQQFLVFGAGRELLVERLAAGTFLRQQFLVFPAGRKLLLERLVAG